MLKIWNSHELFIYVVGLLRCVLLKIIVSLQATSVGGFMKLSVQPDLGNPSRSTYVNCDGPYFFHILGENNERKHRATRFFTRHQKSKCIRKTHALVFFWKTAIRLHLTSIIWYRRVHCCCGLHHREGGGA